MVCSPNVLVRYPNVVVSWLWLALALYHQRQNLDHEGQDPNLDLYTEHLALYHDHDHERPDSLIASDSEEIPNLAW